MTKLFWTLVWRFEVFHHFIFHGLNLIGLVGWLLSDDREFFLSLIAANFLYGYLIITAITQECPATRAENVLRRKVGKPQIKSFWSAYIWQTEKE